MCLCVCALLLVPLRRSPCALCPVGVPLETLETLEGRGGMDPLDILLGQGAPAPPAPASPAPAPAFDASGSFRRRPGRPRRSVSFGSDAGLGCARSDCTACQAEDSATAPKSAVQRRFRTTDQLRNSFFPEIEHLRRMGKICPHWMGAFSAKRKQVLTMPPRHSPLLGKVSMSGVFDFAADRSLEGWRSGLPGGTC